MRLKPLSIRIFAATVLQWREGRCREEQIQGVADFLWPEGL
jgi:hypothetical protein